MKIFTVIQKNYAILGINNSSKQSTQEDPTNKRILFGFLLFGCVIGSQLIYISRVASGFMEYMVCISSISSSALTIISFAAVVFQEHKLFECIDRMEKLVDSSETFMVWMQMQIQHYFIAFSGCKYPQSRTFFLKINQQVERLSELIFMWVMKILLPFEVLPKSLACFGIYFLTDVGRDSFELPFPIW